MPYCSKAIKLNDQCDWPIDEALAEIGKELFKAEAVHHLQGNSYNIDGGENDVRALVEAEERVICLFCRYEKDVDKIEEKLAEFTSRHMEQCLLVAVDHKGKFWL